MHTIKISLYPAKISSKSLNVTQKLISLFLLFLNLSFETFDHFLKDGFFAI